MWKCLDGMEGGKVLCEWGGAVCNAKVVNHAHSDCCRALFDVASQVGIVPAQILCHIKPFCFKRFHFHLLAIHDRNALNGTDIAVKLTFTTKSLCL